MSEFEFDVPVPEHYKSVNFFGYYQNCQLEIKMHSYN
jgi:hypothetical protein